MRHGDNTFSYRHRLKISLFIWLLVTRIGRVGEEMRTIDTVSFITHVPTVISVVALAAPMDASAITAFKLVRTAGGTC